MPERHSRAYSSAPVFGAVFRYLNTTWFQTAWLRQAAARAGAREPQVWRTKTVIKPKTEWVTTAHSPA